MISVADIERSVALIGDNPESCRDKGKSCANPPQPCGDEVEPCTNRSKPCRDGAEPCTNA